MDQIIQLIIGYSVISEFGGTRLKDPTMHPNWYLVNPINCGISNMGDRIIGGTDASLGQFPWIVRIGNGDEEGLSETLPADSLFECGGAIINSRYVITAAHCDPLEYYMYMDFIRVGEHQMSKNPDCEEKENEDNCAPPYKEYKIEKTIIHSSFNKPVRFDNDIALIHTKEEIIFNDFVLPICLPYGELLTKDFTGQMFETAGWGTSKLIKKERTDILQVLQLPYINFSTCQRVAELTINKNQLCLGGIIGKDTCDGDSGGPVMKIESTDNKSYRYYLFGIVSYGPKKCSVTSIPSVYTRITSYLEWILDNIKP